MTAGHQASQPAAGPNPAKIYGVVLSVGIACALAIVLVFELTRPIIQRNRSELRQRAILQVLPEASRIEAFQWNESRGVFEATETNAQASELVFAGFDDSQSLVGVAIETQGMGYQDTIRLLYGYSHASQCIIGTFVLESRETPGLGDRIMKDAVFLRNFDCLDVRLKPSGDELANSIEFVKPGEKTAEWQIDGITGATISSRAVAEMLSGSAEAWVPRVHRQRNDFVVPDRSDA